jgi:hypothetical protein
LSSSIKFIGLNVEEARQALDGTVDTQAPAEHLLGGTAFADFFPADDRAEGAIPVSPCKGKGGHQLRRGASRWVRLSIPYMSERLDQLARGEPVRPTPIGRIGAALESVEMAHTGCLKDGPVPPFESAGYHCSSECREGPKINPREAVGD